MGDQLAVSLRQAAGFAQSSRVRIDFVKEVPAGGEQVDFVRGYQCALREGVVSDELDRGPVGGWLSMQREVDARELGAGNPQIFCPARKDVHDGGLRGRYADKIHRGPA